MREYNERAIKVRNYWFIIFLFIGILLWQWQVLTNIFRTKVRFITVLSAANVEQESLQTQISVGLFVLNVETKLGRERMNKDLLDLEAEREAKAISKMKQVTGHTPHKVNKHIHIGNHFDQAAQSYDKIWANLLKQLKQ